MPGSLQAQEETGVELLSRARAPPVHGQGWQDDSCRGRGLAACWPCSVELGTHGLLTLASGGDVAGLCAGWLRGKAGHSSSSSWEDLGVSWASWKTACLLKDEFSCMLAWETCIAVQSTWWFTEPEKSWCAYLTHLSVVDRLLSLLQKGSHACRDHQGRLRSCQQFGVSRCDQSSYDIRCWALAPSLPTPTCGKADTDFKRKIHCSNGNMQRLSRTA